MRNNLVIFFGALLLASCASTPQSLTFRQQLDIYKDMKIRLYRVASPIKVSSAEICPSATFYNGILAHNLSDYPQLMRPVAQFNWGLTYENAWLYSVRFQDAACTGTLELSYNKEPNAWTDGEGIFVTPSLLNKVDDLSLALIIAHELAHIALNHADKEPSEKLEREADRFALFMLARADLDYRKAALQDTASKPPDKGGQKYLDTRNREVYFREVIAEIDKLKKEGKALVP